MKNKRIVWIDLYKAVGFFFVLFGHLEIPENFTVWVYSFHMPLFLLATGLTFNIEKTYRANFKDYLSVRFKRLIVPYFWLQMISLAILFLRRTVLGGSVPDLTDYLCGILISNTQINQYSPGPALYYIVLLFFAEIAFWAVIKVAKGNKRNIFFVLFLLLPISFINRGRSGPMHLFVVPVAMMIIFVGRMLMDAYNDGLKEKLSALSPLKYSALCIALLAVGTLLAFLNGRSSLHTNKYGKDFAVYILCALAMNVAIALIVMRVSERLPDKIQNMYVYVGQSTLFYLGAHSQIKNVFEQIGRRFTDIESWPFIIVTVFILYFLLIPLSKITDRCFPFVVGKSTVNPSARQKFGQIFMTFFAFAPVFYMTVFQISRTYLSAFASTAMGTAVIYSAATVLWAVLCLVIREVADRIAPVVYLIEKPKGKNDPVC